MSAGAKAGCVCIVFGVMMWIIVLLLVKFSVELLMPFLILIDGR